MTVQSNPQHSPTADAVNLTPNAPISTDLQILGEGVMAEWLLDHQISAVYVSEMTIASVDVWVDYAKKVLQASRQESPTPVILGSIKGVGRRWPVSGLVWAMSG